MRRGSKGFTFKRSTNECKLGFTFIEILVVMSLIGFMTGGVLVSYRQSSNKQSLDAARQKLRQAYTTARANSLAGKKDAITCGTVPLDGWIVNLNTSTTPVTYTLYGQCGVQTFPNPAAIEQMPNGVTVTTTDSQTLFKPLNRGTDSTAVTNITLQNVSGSYSFTVSTSGELLDPTPTTSSCRNPGQTCYDNGQCCSGSCNGSTCL